MTFNDRNCNISSETTDNTEILWREEESAGEYSYPINPNTENFLDLGQQIAQIDPPENLDTLKQIGPFLITTSPVSHYEAHKQSIDFLVPDGTPVIAMADGKIYRVIANNDQHGNSPEYSQFANMISILHENGEISEYIHLAKDSVPEKFLEIGTKVHKGEKIGLTGMTGWTDRPHLHCAVYRIEESENIDGKIIPNPYGKKSLKPRFEK